MLLVLSSCYFYLLLCAYYIIRPIRSEMVIQNGVANVQWLFLAAAIVMLCITPIFGWLSSRLSARSFISYCTLFFVANLCIFFFLFNQEVTNKWVSRSFFIWVNVFNMFIMSLFWSFMNDIYSSQQAKRLFPVIAAGGTAGALTGPIITTTLVNKVGLSYLLLCSGFILSLTTLCILLLSKKKLSKQKLNKQKLTSDKIDNNTTPDTKLKGGVFDGIKLAIQSPYLRLVLLFVVVYAVLSTFLSVQLAEIIEQNFPDSTQRTKLFAQADLITNILTLAFQLTLTSKLIKWIGYQKTLMLLPVGLTIGFILIGFFPTFIALISLSIFNRAGKYSVLNPTSEMLFSILSREEKYKAKNFIDTAVVRSSNVLSSWLYAGSKALGASGVGITLIGVTLGSIWCVTSFKLGKQFTQKEKSGKPEE